MDAPESTAARLEEATRQKDMVKITLFKKIPSFQNCLQDCVAFAIAKLLGAHQLQASRLQDCLSSGRPLLDQWSKTVSWEKGPMVGTRDRCVVCIGLWTNPCTSTYNSFHDVLKHNGLSFTSMEEHQHSFNFLSSQHYFKTQPLQKKELGVCNLT